MLTTSKSKISNTPTVLRRMRESSGLTMRQAAGIIGFSHTAISQFENGKMSLPDYRIEQMVKAYGFSQEEFNKILGRPPIISPKDDCYAMIERMDEEQLLAVRSIMNQLLRQSHQLNVAK